MALAAYEVWSHKIGSVFCNALTARGSGSCAGLTPYKHERASTSKRGIACMCLSHYRDEGKATHTVYSGIDDPGNSRNGD